MAIAVAVVGTWYVSGGHQGVIKNMRKAQIAMFRNLGNTSHWGNPSPWKYRGPSMAGHVKRHSYDH